MQAVTERKTAEERREAVLAEALGELAAKGYDGASTDAIARRAGISQPYLFRLFGTKKALYLATVERCFTLVLETFREAAAGAHGEEALVAMGQSYLAYLGDPRMLPAQLHAYAAACEDEDVRVAVRRGYGRLYEYVERTSGASPERVKAFFADGMFLNVASAMGLWSVDERWARALLDACRYG